ncbi:MAG TPA: MFS transporter [Spirochaetota bacterium]|nr:MFS transporter [Spirochaetota bacterium]
MGKSALGSSSIGRRFTAMATAYFMGSFNDNFFKQSVLIIAVAIGSTHLQGWGVSVFTFPFLLLAAPAGWLSDRFSKRRVVIASKWMELAAMIAGAAGLLSGHWILIFVMLFIMGTQAAIFSPAINGSIPEVFPENQVIRVNGILRFVVTASILLGIALAGLVLDIKGKGPFGLDNGRIAVACVIIIMSVLGLIAGYGVSSKSASSPRAPFPWHGPVNTLKVLLETRKDVLLTIAIYADVFIWFMGSLELLLINPMGLTQFVYSKTTTSLLLVAQVMGLGVGGLLASRFARGDRWYRVLIPSGLLMSLFMILLSFVPLLPAFAVKPALFFFVACVGIFGGLFMIPLESFVQIRPSADRKGSVWASANFVVFSGILLSGPVSNLFNVHWRMNPTTSFGIIGGISAAVTLFIFFTLRRCKFL